MKTIKLYLLIILFPISLISGANTIHKSYITSSITNPGDTVFKRVEVQPKYKGGTGALYKFINENIIYPPEAKEKGIQGKVIVKFVVSSKGKVSNAIVFRGINKLLDEEAVRVINLLPDWTPGQIGGKAIPSYVQIPVHFKLK